MRAYQRTTAEKSPKNQRFLRYAAENVSVPSVPQKREERCHIKTGISLLDQIEVTTRKYYRAKAQARNTEDNIALSISCAPSETGLRPCSAGSRVELGAMLRVEAEQKAEILRQELTGLRLRLKPFLAQLPAGAEKTALRMYYLRGQSLATIAGKLAARDKRNWTADSVINALQRGVLVLEKIINA